MTKNQRLQDWERQAIADAYTDGEKVTDIASEFGINPAHVRVIARKEKRVLRLPGRPTKPLRKEK